MYKSYAGIGSRETPPNILKIMNQVAKHLAANGYILRSGGANGCDLEFEYGCNRVNGLKEIYLPWSGFNNSNSKLIVKDKRAFEIAEKYHPYWSKLSQGAAKLQARNSHQILGMDLNTPCEFVICYTKKGKMIGGTSQAMRIAKDYNIPIFNLGTYEDSEDEFIIKELKKFLNENMKENK